MYRWCFLLLMFLANTTVHAAWIIEGFVGGATSLSTNLNVQQENLPDTDIDADYESRSFDSPLYYSVRGSRVQNGRAWEVELIHLKVFLTNPEPPLIRLSISHGYNLLLLNHAWDVAGFQIRVGGGAVIAHPEVETTGAFSSDYQFTGPAFQLGAGRRFYVSDTFFLNVEGKISVARARVTIPGGSAGVPNVAFHALAGIGLRL